MAKLKRLFFLNSVGLYGISRCLVFTHGLCLFPRGGHLLGLLLWNMFRIVLHKRSLFPSQPGLIENKHIFTLYSNTNCSYCLEWEFIFLKSKETENGGKALWARKSSWLPHFFQPTCFNGRDCVMPGDGIDQAMDMLETNITTSVSKLLEMTPLVNTLDKARKALLKKENGQNRYYQK